MPERSTLHRTVRSHEIDANGIVPPATILRWCQDVALFASAENGFDTARYRELGCTWFVREYQLEVLTDLHQNDAYAIATWAAPFQRILGPRQYRIARPDGTTVANCAAIWVYIDRETGRPRRIDQAWIDEFPRVDEYVIADPDWGTDALAAESPPDGTHEMIRDVMWSELDGSRHVNNTVYASWVIDQLAEAAGCAEMGPVRRLRIAYDRAVQPGSRITLRMAPAGQNCWVQVVEDGGEEPVARAVVQTAPRHSR